MKKLKEHRNAIGLILILGAMGLLGLSYPYGSSSWFRSGQCFPLADSLETSFFRCPAWYSNAVANLGIKPYNILEMDWAISGHPERSMVDLFVPSVQQIIDRAGMSQSDTTRAKHYRLALFKYFWYERWPTKNDSIWQNWMGSYYRTLSNFGGTRPDYVELTNCLNCCHRSQVLRWLAFGFGRDRSLHGQDSLDYLVGKFYLWPEDTTVVVRILHDDVIDSIWPGNFREDSAANNYIDTLCVCELYYLFEEDTRADTIYFTIPYSLKQYIIGVGPASPTDPSGVWSPKWYAKHVLEPVYDTLHKYNPNVKVIGPSIALAEHDRTSETGHEFSLLPYDTTVWPEVKDPKEVGKYLDTLLHMTDAKDYMDLISVHLYTHTLGGTHWPGDTLPKILRDWKSEGYLTSSDPPLWITETSCYVFEAKNLPGTNPVDSLINHARAIVQYQDVYRHFGDSIAGGIDGITLFSLDDEWDDTPDTVLAYGLCYMPEIETTETRIPRPAYYAYQNYIQAYALNDTLLASRHDKATFGPGNKLALVPGLPITKCWVAFPYKEYVPAQESLVLKGIRVLKMDTLGNVDSVINLTTSPYNKVDQVAIAVAGGRPCIAFTTSDSGNLFYWYRGLANPVRLWSSGTHTGQALFPDIQGLGDTIHLFFYGRYQSSCYVRWLKFRYDEPSSNPTNLNVGAEPAWLSFDLNSQRYPWAVWGRENSVYLSRWDGSAWGATKTVASSYAKWPDIAMSGSDTARVAWHNSDKDSVFVRGYQPYNPFGTPIFNGSVGPAKAEASYPRIDYYSNKAYLLWADSNRVEVDPQTHSVNPYKPWSYDILYAHGRSSFTRASMGDTPLHSFYPSLSVRATDKIVSVLTEGEYDIHRAYYRPLEVD